MRCVGFGALGDWNVGCVAVSLKVRDVSVGSVQD